MRPIVKLERLKNKMVDFLDILKSGVSGISGSLFGGNIRQGSWGLPEFGATEALAKGASGGQTTDLSNALAGYYPSGSVLGTSEQPPYQRTTSGFDTSSSTGGNTPTGGSTPTGGGGGFPEADYRARGWNDMAAAEADWNAKQAAGGGGGSQSIEDLISEQYGPALEALRGIEGSLFAGKEEALGNVESQFTKGGETIGREQTELEAALAEQGRTLGESARSAYADATRAYNNLIQQGLSRFGAGSSAGPAVQELVTQEFLRSRGKMGQQQVAGEQQIAGEQTKLTNYLAQKRDDLEGWKTEAIFKINENFRNSLAEINSRKADIEANRTRDKIAALQRAVDQAETVKNTDREYRLGLAQFAVEQMQTFANRAFTPQEIGSIVNQMMNEPLAFGERTAATGTAYRPTGTLTKEQEELQNLQAGGQG